MASQLARHDEQVRDFFDTNVVAYDNFYEEPTAFGRWFNRTFRKAVYIRRDQVIPVARKHGCKTILDVGCGTGRNSIWWAQRGIEHVYGVDLSADMIRKATEIASQLGAGDRCVFAHGDFMQTDPPGKYDMVVACGVFDYVRDAAPFLRRMAQFANKAIYASFPGWALVRAPLRKIRYALRGCPTHFYRRSDVLRLFEGVGFGPTETLYTGSGHLAWSGRS